MSYENDPGQESGEETAEKLRAEIDEARGEIDRTVSQIERRLEPERIRILIEDRLRQATAPWRERPADQLEAVGRETMTRVRELAWMNPVGLGIAAVVVGYLLGRKSSKRAGRSPEP